VRSPSTDNAAGAEPVAEEPNYYDVLQIGVKAEAETIYRVYRIMAARFHPTIKDGRCREVPASEAAYEVLSDPARRSEYDSRREKQDTEPMPIFRAEGFCDRRGVRSDRRLECLSLLYNQRRRTRSVRQSRCSISNTHGVSRANI